MRASRRVLYRTHIISHYSSRSSLFAVGRELWGNFFRPEELTLPEAFRENAHAVRTKTEAETMVKECGAERMEEQQYRQQFAMLKWQSEGLIRRVALGSGGRDPASIYPRQTDPRAATSENHFTVPTRFRRSVVTRDPKNSSRIFGPEIRARYSPNTMGVVCLSSPGTGISTKKLSVECLPSRDVLHGGEQWRGGRVTSAFIHLSACLKSPSP